MNIKGFSAAAMAAGIRYKDRLDLALIYSEVPAVATGVFTTNKIKAAPLLLDMERLGQGRAQAVLINSGNANACNGPQGMETAVAASAVAARELGIDEKLVQVASTGVIGQPMDLKPFEAAVPQLVRSLSPEGFDDVARAVMTTDTVPKTSARQVEIDGVEVSLLGIAKGSGMIMPDMATMLCFIMTDAQIVFQELQAVVRRCVDLTFNRITVDGDTSTNDMVLALANGAAGNTWIDEENPQGREALEAAVLDICRDLAIQIVADGEGATKLVTIRVIGARDDEGAMAAAQTIANSALVKTAFFGEDANWGRIMAALGRSGCLFDPEKVAIYFDDAQMVRDGAGLGAAAEEACTAVLRQDRFTVTVDLQDGLGTAEVHTCDLSLDYVRINADYRS
ncbi:MAG: bifunctional glutamate N-acetyltransferase/amino-acid acetyltransferase ArgJ [Desulfobulbaceae bacterium]|jgi:glutamate N-acetyltransferase/amino-acid N-acetyltransferase|nr:bifunctional glutamate N-acetyltransferase/amino-acid acetyltransferase ArgJ [Desulfobulbaceae bacterium]